MTTEHRKERRFPFHWPVAIVFEATENQDTYHGVTHDISMDGCSVLTDHNIFSEHPVAILLSMPAENPTGRRRVVEAKANMVYTVLSAGHQRFRCGIQFISFKGRGKATLKRNIEMREVSAAAHDAS